MKTYHYVKQCIPWANYLKRMGWKYFYTDDQVGIAVLKTVVGNVCKVQRPYVLNSKVIADIEDICRQNKVALLKLEPNIGQDISLLEKEGFKLSSTPLSPSKSMFINLENSEEELWKNISRSGKNGVNRANRKEAHVHFYQNPSIEKLREYDKILKQTQRRGKFISHSLKENLVLSEEFADNAFLSLVYNRDDTLAGGKFYLGDKDVITYINGATAEAGLNTKAGYKLFWEDILYFKKRHYKIFDLEGCYDERYPHLTQKWKGFTEFKRKFGPETIEFPGAYSKYYSLIFRLLFKDF